MSTKTMNVKVSVNTHYALKLWCFQNGSNMSKFTLEAICEKMLREGIEATLAPKALNHDLV